MTVARTLRDSANRFFRFALLSGIGWLCDFASYSLLVETTGIQPSVANFVSSYVGVTFVYFTSLRFVFARASRQPLYFIGIFWAYHLVSILGYSALLAVVVGLLEHYEPFFSAHVAIQAKIIVTPLNLATNFLFMGYLGRYMRCEREHS